ncbi:J domain-containing protein [Halorussus aquaticus]|uniref:DnaJ domain-containing protein n=1 Tax=Halorussus aquaticus TaxID=2953748 RepID=A0ABD5PYI8_9EURY|nr:J domain-containing protein [Halorussus aquaticus]
MSELDWPTGFARTESQNRERNNRFEASLRDSIDDLESELERLDVDDWRLSTDARHQKRNPKYPYADASPDDPSAVVRWTMDGDQFAVACDAYSRLRDNVRTLYLYIREKRKMEQRPVVTGESEFANARLPSGDDGHAVVAQEPPHEILGVERGADADEVREAFRREVQTVHPDHGGSEAEFRRVKDAREAMLGE